MEQRDYIMVQIEQLGAVLQALLSTIRGKTKGHSEAGITKEVSTVFSNDLKLNLNSIIDGNQDLEELNDGRWTSENLDILSSVLKEQANDKELTAVQRKNLLKRALEICHMVDSEADSYSIELHSRINEITDELNRLD